MHMASPTWEPSHLLLSEPLFESLKWHPSGTFTGLTSDMLNPFSTFDMYSTCDIFNKLFSLCWFSFQEFSSLDSSPSLRIFSPTWPWDSQSFSFLIRQQAYHLHTVVVYVAPTHLSWSAVVFETHMSCVFLRICHVSTCCVHFNIAVFVQHR